MIDFFGNWAPTGPELEGAGPHEEADSRDAEAPLGRHQGAGPCTEADSQRRGLRGMRLSEGGFAKVGIP